MNWARDNAHLTDADLETVFKYAPKDSTVISMSASNDWQIEISSRESEKSWSQWIEDELPSINGDDSGLVLLLAKRDGELPGPRFEKVSYDHWIKRANMETQPVSDLKRANTFSALEEKASLPRARQTRHVPIGRRGVRTVPFSKDTFEKVSNDFHTHASIARVVSRSDVPLFSYDRVNMHESAYVYNCRSSNAWEMDLALTVTHFPHKSQTFAILFGCPFSLEKEVITRLANIREEAAHPLVLPGIFAEIERRRHAALVEEMGNKLETLIYQLDYQSNHLYGNQDPEPEAKSREKRTAYLDLVYLRNGLVSWNTQMTKMVQHCRQLIESEYRASDSNFPRTRLHRPRSVSRNFERTTSRVLEESRSLSSDEWFEVDSQTVPDFLTEDDISLGNSSNDPMAKSIHGETHQTSPINKLVHQPYPPHKMMKKDLNKNEYRDDRMLNVSFKIKSRLMAIRDEYDDRIRDCTMRIDGMSMATQWSHGETNVEIALATNRDSRQMRSIALVTMIFLPGTFFASMFSMTFFQWSNESASSTVSKYIWIYFLVTILFTALTISLWYYFVIYKSRHNMTDEEDGSSIYGRSDKDSNRWVGRFKRLCRRYLFSRP